MSLYNGPPRGGTRGGKDQFSWDAVKADKDREYYLGHSVKATTGRWQKGKDVFWYTREKQDEGDTARAELLAVKQREEDLMAEALGIKPKTIRAPKQPSLDQKDLQQLMQKGEEEEDAAEGGDREAERIKGLGFTVNAVRGAGDAEHDVLPGTVPVGGPPHPGGGPNGALPPPPQLSADDAKRLRKAQKRAAKEARRAVKKEEKKAKKALKKAKKLAKKAKVEEEQQQQQPEESGSSSGSGHSDSSQPESHAEERHGQAGPGGGRHREDRVGHTATGHGSRLRQELAPGPERQPEKRGRAASPEERHPRSGRGDGHGRSSHGDSPARGDRHGRSRHGDSPARRAGRADDRYARDRDDGSPSRRLQRRSRSPEHKARRRE